MISDTQIDTKCNIMCTFKNLIVIFCVVSTASFIRIAINSRLPMVIADLCDGVIFLTCVDIHLSYVNFPAIQMTTHM